MKCYDCNKECEFNQDNITFKDDLEVLMCKQCVDIFRKMKN